MSARSTTGHTDGVHDLFSGLDDLPTLPQPTAPAPQRPVPPAQQVHLPAAAPTLSYAEALRLMALGRAQGPEALTPEQHHAIWDCLLERPESQAWLATQLEALQGELQERGLVPWQDGERR